ncbi:hypothetical protein CFC21_025562 [Triticum aestivum]|uniref:Uncharacterized protein n=2 Tax=Triticum aestivum TaxID=4565 RepID=A0A9R1EIR4_WHEAT|nr:hypothetical protein CFC21_025562 [Triticum aestivum]
METLSNLTSLARLSIYGCGEDLRCEGLLPLLTRGQLSHLDVQRIPNFFGAWDPMWGMQEEQNKRTESKLQYLETDEALFADQEIARFTKEQEEAFHHLTSLQQLRFWRCDKLQHLPAGLNKLQHLKRLGIWRCPALRSLPKEGLPSSLRELDVEDCGTKELTEHCKQLRGTIPKVTL